MPTDATKGSVTCYSSSCRIYEYLNDTLIPAMQPMVWYDNYTIPGAGFMIDVANKYIGVARLRHHRMNPYPCTIPDVMKFLNMSCWPEFSLGKAEDGSFGASWGQQVPDTIDYNRLRSIWEYQNQEDTGSLGSFGRIAYYPGGGYIAFLGRTLYNSYVNLFQMTKQFWFDHKSRGLFVEFLVYNANYNVFAAVSLLFEQSGTGYTYKTIDIHVVRMLFVQNEIELAEITFFVIFVFWVAMLMLKLSRGIFRHLGSFYKKVWLMIDLLINTMSIICISIFVLRIKMVESYLEELEAVKHNEFVSYFALMYVEEFLKIFMGILVCVATIRLWKFLRFGLFFRIMERTLSVAASALLGVTLAFFLILTAFGLTGIMIYGREHPELSTFMNIVTTLIQMALKPEDFELSKYLYLNISFYYYTVYLVIMQVILFLYIIIVIMGYLSAKLEYSVPPDSYTVNDYVTERMQYIPRLMKTKIHRLKGGAKKEKSPVTPKANEFRYANCFGIQKSRCESIGFIISCVIRNMTQSSSEQEELTDYETEMMLGVWRAFVMKPTNNQLELFFKGHFVGEMFRFVDEKRITKMAEFAQLMFKPPAAKEVVKKPESKAVRLSKMAHQKLWRLKTWNLKFKLMRLQMEQCEQILNDVLKDI